MNADQLLPQNFYIAIGALVICNIGVLITIITFIFKAGMFVANTKTGIKDAKDSAVRAHKRIDSVESQIKDLG